MNLHEAAAVRTGQRVFADALLAPERRCPPGLRAWNGSDPDARFAVYRNNVVSSLIDAVADTFPVTQELVGEEFFRAMAALFVRQHPPRSPVLPHYGAAFAGFVEDFEPARSVPYLADVARLEYARVQACHAADAPPLDREAIGAALAAGEDLAELRLVGHPSLGVVRSAYAIVSIWAAHQGEGDLADVDPACAQSALVLRPDHEVLVLALPAGADRFILALLAGQGLAQAAAAAAAEDAGFDLPAALALLLRHGAWCSLRFHRSPSP